MTGRRAWSQVRNNVEEHACRAPHHLRLCVGRLLIMQAPNRVGGVIEGDGMLRHTDIDTKSCELVVGVQRREEAPLILR